MKRIVLLFCLFGMVSSLAMAQDDMYFTPKKADKDKETVEQRVTYVVERPVFVRDVDEYNRRGRFANDYFGISADSLYSDVIDLDTLGIDTVAIDTAFVDDFDYSYNPEDDYAYSRQMSRFDDFYWYDPWYHGWYGYGPYWYGSPYWHAGWWWYDPWYDPWYYGWYGHWWWHRPLYSYYRPYRGVTGTMNHGRLYGHRGGASNNFRGYRGNYNGSNNGLTGRRYPSRDNNSYNSNTSRNRFRGNRPNRNTLQNTQSRPSFNNSFGGNRSGGSFRGGGSFGGSRGGGGGGFRGRR